MPRKTVTHYAVFHNIGAGTDVVLYYEGGGAETVTGLPYAEAAFIVDLLRNEKPVSYDAALRRVSTLYPEPTGESE
jgi:hypothetical protein